MVNASLGWLNNVSGVYLIQVSLLLIGQLGLGPANRYKLLQSIQLDMTDTKKKR
jgi:hypothetical protein